MNNIRNSIGWADWSWNPITGCKRECPYCYARKIRQRFTPNIPFTELMWFDERLKQPLKLKKPSRIFVGSMSDIEYWRKCDMDNVFKIIKQCPQHTFLFLTKNGEVYGNYYFPDNCWLGITVPDGNGYHFNIWNKKQIIFLSLEPLLNNPPPLWLNSTIDWVIVGGLTPKSVHKKEWIDNILKEADRLKIPVFLKGNANYPKIRQEFPNE